MSIYLRFFLTFISLSILIIYFFSNIQNMREGSVSISFLFLFLFISTAMVILNILSGYKIFIKKSFIFYVLFLNYLIFKIIIDTENISFLIVRLIDTSTGIVLFFCIGILSSLGITDITKKSLSSNKYLKVYNCLFILFILFILFTTINTTIGLFDNLRVDKLLVEGIGPNYQRLGNFLIIYFFIFSYLFLTFIILNKKKKIFFLMIYILISIINMLNSQLIGSNMGFLGLLVITVLTIFFHLFYSASGSKFFLVNFKLTIKSIFFSKIILKLGKYIFISLILLSICLLVMMYYSSLDISMFRLSGFGEGNTSIDSRIKMWAYFIENFSFSPLFGHIRVEVITGTGHYTHSFLGYMLSHLGILGTSIFLIYLYISIKVFFLEFNSFNNIELKALNFYCLIVFIMFFSLGNIATPMYWIVLWFIIGFIFNPILLKLRG